jgi:hypothetical protein
MTRRRFLFLAGALIGLNTFFWLAQGGFALPGALIDRFFGPKLIRAEVVVGGPRVGIEDFRIDRGVITSVGGGAIVIRERDGTVVSIAVTPATKIVGAGPGADASQLRKRMRVLVVRPLNMPARQIQVEGPG